jgi:hypothetical protein
MRYAICFFSAVPLICMSNREVTIQFRSATVSATLSLCSKVHCINVTGSHARTHTTVHTFQPGTRTHSTHNTEQKVHIPARHMHNTEQKVHTHSSTQSHGDTHNPRGIPNCQGQSAPLKVDHVK